MIHIPNNSSFWCIQFNGFQYIHRFMQSQPQSIFKLSLLSKETRNPVPISINLQFSSKPLPLLHAMDLFLLVFSYKRILHCDCLFSLSIMLSRFIHVVSCISTSFLLTEEQYSIVWICHILFIHSSTDGHH